MTQRKEIEVVCINCTSSYFITVHWVDDQPRGVNIDQLQAHLKECAKNG